MPSNSSLPVSLDTPLIYGVSCKGTAYLDVYLPSLIQSIYNLHADPAGVGERPVRLIIVTDHPSHLVLERARAKLRDRMGRVTIDLLPISASRSSDSYTQVASSKIADWHSIAVHAEKEFGGNGYVVFLDADTVVRRDLTEFFGHQFDVAYTYYENHVTPYGDRTLTRNGYKRLNSGVVLARLSTPPSSFLQEWSLLVARVSERGSPLKGEFKGEDQDTLALLLGAQLKRRHVLFGRKEVVGYSPGNPKLVGVRGSLYLLRGFPCSELNEPESIGDITANAAAVFHYKGGWRHILPEPDWEEVARRCPTRAKDNSLAQYELWRRLRCEFFAAA